MSAFGLGVANSAINMGFNMIQGAGSGLINNLFYKRNLDLQVEKQKELFDYQNEYNSPANQYQRLLAAGLNPNLMYGENASSGNGSMPSSPSGVANPGNYSTRDVVSGALQFQQLKQVEADLELKTANARLINAQAGMAEQQLERNPEMLDLTISKANKDLEEAASRIDLNKSSISLNSAKQALAVADEAFKRGEISLQTYRKQQIVAQTMLYTSEKDHYKIQNALDSLELKYQKYFYSDDGQIKWLSEMDRERAIKQMRIQTAEAAAELDIKGSKALKWVDYITDRLSRVFGVASKFYNPTRTYKKQ